MTGRPGEPPTRSGNAIGDVLAGISLCTGLLAALNARHSTGRGQYIDVSLADSVIMSLENATMRYFATGVEPERLGNRYAAAAPYDSYRSKNGYFVLGCANQSLFVALCERVLNMPELLEDPRFETVTLRVKNQDALAEIIQSWADGYSTAEAVDMILNAGVPAAPIMTVGQVVTDRYYNEERNMFPVIHHPVIGDMHVNGPHIKMSETMPSVREPAPSLGQHNSAVYMDWLGKTDDQLREMKERGVV